MFEQVGGREFFVDLVADFYIGVAGDDVLRPMYPDSELTEAAERLTLFLVQYWGGPSDYQEARGHPRLRMRHAPFPVDEVARDRWLQCMAVAVANRGLEPELAQAFWTYFTMAAESMINTPTTHTG